MIYLSIKVTLSLEEITDLAGFNVPENMRYYFANANLFNPNYYRNVLE